MLLRAPNTYAYCNIERKSFILIVDYYHRRWLLSPAPYQCFQIDVACVYDALMVTWLITFVSAANSRINNDHYYESVNLDFFSETQFQCVCDLWLEYVRHSGFRVLIYAECKASSGCGTGTHIFHCFYAMRICSSTHSSVQLSFISHTIPCFENNWNLFGGFGWLVVQIRLIFLIRSILRCDYSDYSEWHNLPTYVAQYYDECYLLSCWWHLIVGHKWHL